MPISGPFGAADALVIAATGTTAYTVVDQEVYATPLTTLTGNATLNLTISDQVRAGAKLFLQVKTAATETFTFGTGFIAPTVTGVAGKTWTQGFWYNGSVYVPMGAKIQID